MVKRRALPPRYREARPKQLRYELFTLPGKLAIHQSQLSVRVPADEERLREIVEARGRLLAMLDERRARAVSTGELRRARTRTRPRRGRPPSRRVVRAEIGQLTCS